ncbi:helix-turn-helix domain-containing protein [Clostridium perfringens]|nr:helix-turn-helix domain-containing protein [Clostridium perfringens]
MEDKPVLTPMEASKLLRVGRNTMYNDLLKRKGFPSFKIGNKYYISRVKLEEWIKKQCK